MAFAGIRTFFKLNNVDISRYLDGVTPSSQTDELDGTTFQPGVAAPIKDIIAGFRTRALALSSKWTPEAELFFSGVEGQQALPYIYGPLGKDEGMTGIKGICTVLSWTGPVSTVDGIITGSAEVRCSTREVGTFDASGDVIPVAAATGATAGTPGSFTPGGAMAPGNFAALSSVVASPTTAWTTGQHVILGDLSHAFWNGTAWMVGNAS
jgi:hypothetical protein